MLGYGSSSPASASLFIYDPTTSSMTTSYSAPSPGSTPAVASISPALAHTHPNPNSNGGRGTSSPVSSSGDPSDTSDSSSGSSNHVAAIVLGTIFGVFGLIAGGLATIYYMKRRHNRGRRTAGRFIPLADDPEPSSEQGSVGGAVPEAVHLDGQTDERARGVGSSGVIMDILAHIGVDKFNRRPNEPRKDMFMDEDTRSFGWPGPSGTVQKQYGDGTSAWSLRSVSALVRGVISREPSRSGLEQGDREWEKHDHLREGVKEGLILRGSLRSEYSSHLTHQREGSFWSYTEPLEDLGPDDGYDGLNLRPGVPEKNADNDCSIRISDDKMSAPLGPQDFVSPFSARSRTLTPLKEASHASLPDPSDSLPPLQESSNGQLTFGYTKNAALPPPISSSTTLYSPTASDTHPIAPTPHSPTSGSSLTYSPSITRPDSWWSRLAKSPLLDRRTSITSSKPLEFRDPTPAPPLGELEEAKKSSATSDSSDSRPADTDVPAEHGRSLSSAHSGRTANTDSAEHLGASYDVVQRLPSGGSSLGRAPSLGSAEISEQGMYAVNAHARSEISLSSSLPHVDPPHSTLSPASPATAMVVETLTEPPALSESSPTTPKRGALVSSRVREYERKLSQDLGSQQITPPRNTRRREEVPSRTRPTIQYGVAPRTSLFIANPDLGRLS